MREDVNILLPTFSPCSTMCSNVVFHRYFYSQDHFVHGKRRMCYGFPSYFQHSKILRCERASAWILDANQLSKWRFCSHRVWSVLFKTACEQNYRFWYKTVSTWGRLTFSFMTFLVTILKMDISYLSSLLTPKLLNKQVELLQIGKAARTLLFQDCYNHNL